MLDGVQNDCGTFVYYPLEDVQAKTRPEHCAQESSNCDTDRVFFSLTRKIYEAGHDYLFADREDLVNAAKSAAVENSAGTGEKSRPVISGIKVKNIIIPAMDVIWPDAWDALEALSRSGVNIWFSEKIPTERVGNRGRFEWYNFREESVRGPKCSETSQFRAMTEDEILSCLKSQEQELKLEAIRQSNNAASDTMILKARFVKDGRILYFVVNNSEEDVQLSWEFDGANCAEVWDPSDGSVHTVQKGTLLNLASYRGIFVSHIFDKIS